MPFAFDLGRGGRHEDRRRRVEVLRRVRDAEAVIARGAGDDAARAHLGRQRREHVERAAQLERAGDLRVLELEVHVAAGDRAERVAPDERRAFDERANAIAGGETSAARRSKRTLRSEATHRGLVIPSAARDLQFQNEVTRSPLPFAHGSRLVDVGSSRSLGLRDVWSGPA